MLTKISSLDDAGFCPPAVSKTGAKLSSEVTLEVDLNLNADLGEDTDGPEKTFTLFVSTTFSGSPHLFLPFFPPFSTTNPLKTPKHQHIRTHVDPSTESIPPPPKKILTHNDTMSLPSHHTKKPYVQRCIANKVPLRGAVGRTVSAVERSVADCIGRD